MIGSHLKKCAVDSGVVGSLSGIKLKQLEFKHQINKDKFTALFNDGYSVKDFKEKLNIDTKACTYLQKAYALTRTKKETKFLKVNKTKLTNILKYGVESTNSLSSVKNKKKETLTRKYGVDNPAKVKEFSDKAVATKLDRYGTLSPFVNKSPEEIANIMEAAWEGSRKRWNSYNTEEKVRWIELLVDSRDKWWSQLNEKEKEEFLQKSTSYRSKLEINIETLLVNNSIPFEIQKWIKNRSYDFYFPTTNTILEIQGDYWHGNPLIYDGDLILRFPLKQKVKVCDLWKKDEDKKQLAESYGYKVVYLWETDINNMSEEELVNNLHNYAK